MKTIAEVSKEALKIESVLKTLQPGEYISYQQIQTLSGVKMDNRGRQFMRTAINRLKLEYTCRHGEGIELSGPTNSVGIIASRVIKIDNSVKRAHKTTKRIADAHYRELSEEDQRHVLFVQSALSPLRAYSKSARLFFKKENNKIANI